MIKLTLTISLVFGFIICCAQKHNTLNKDSSFFKHAPLYVLQLPLSNPIEASGVLVKPTDIDSINVYQDDSTKREYGEKAANGLIIIKAKKTIKILTMSQLLAVYNIKDNNLPVFIDSTIAYKPNDYVFDNKMIRSVKVQTDEDGGLKYISIITIFPIHRNKEDEIYIR